jgi:ribosomal protein L21E
LLQEGTDQRYGARHLKRAIERYVVYPLANLLATQQVKVGDLVRIDWDGVHKELTFVRESQGALLMVEQQTEEAAAVVANDEGLGKMAPAEAIAAETKMVPALPAVGQAVARTPAQNRKKGERTS